MSPLNWGSLLLHPNSASKCFRQQSRFTTTDVSSTVYVHAHSQMYTQYYSLRTQREKKKKILPAKPSTRSSPLDLTGGLESKQEKQPRDTTNHILQFHGFSFFFCIVLYKHCQHFFFLHEKKCTTVATNQQNDFKKKRKKKSFLSAEKYCLSRSKNGNVGDRSSWQRLQ